MREEKYGNKLQIIMVVIAIIAIVAAMFLVDNEKIVVWVSSGIAIACIVIYFFLKNNTAKSKIAYIHDLEVSSIIWRINDVSECPLDDDHETRQAIQSVKDDMYNYYSSWFIDNKVTANYPREIIDLSEDEFFFAKLLPFTFSAIRKQNSLLSESDKELVEKGECPHSKTSIALYKLYYGGALLITKRNKDSLIKYSEYKPHIYNQIANALKKETAND